MTTRDEIKAKNFKTLAQKRVKMVEEALRKIRNLSNIGNYHYTDAQVEKIFDFLDGELKKTRNAFFNAAKDDGFSL